VVWHIFLKTHTKNLCLKLTFSCELHLSLKTWLTVTPLIRVHASLPTSNVHGFMPPYPPQLLMGSCLPTHLKCLWVHASLPTTNVYVFMPPYPPQMFMGSCLPTHRKRLWVHASLPTSNVYGFMPPYLPHIQYIRTLSVNIKFICTSFRNRQNSEHWASFSGLFRSECK
jgi:hypothetical protein